jgi:hypothetical protein
MEITFDKRTYNIKDGDDTYEVNHIIKHPLEGYPTNGFYVTKFIESSDVPEASGFHYFEPSDELLERIKETVREYEK